MRKDSCVLYTNRALAKINLGLMDEAESDCDRALRINPRSLNAALYKAEAACGLGRTREAEELLAAALEDHPDETDRVRGSHDIMPRLFVLNVSQTGRRPVPVLTEIGHFGLDRF